MIEVTLGEIRGVEVATPFVGAGGQIMTKKKLRRGTRWAVFIDTLCYTFRGGAFDVERLWAHTTGKVIQVGI